MIRTVVVEVEPLARDYLISLLTRTGRVEVVGEAAEARSGLRLCRQAGVDAAFLDIRLPGPDGLTLGAMLARLPEPPLLVFVTGCASYAVDAFRMHAADYLLKPLEASRVEETVLYLERRLRERQSAPAEGEREPVYDYLPVRDRRQDVARLLARRIPSNFQLVSRSLSAASGMLPESPPRTRGARQGPGRPPRAGACAAAASGPT